MLVVVLLGVVTLLVEVTLFMVLVLVLLVLVLLLLLLLFVLAVFWLRPRCNRHNICSARFAADINRKAHVHQC